MRLLPSPARLVPVILGLLLAIAVVPVLAGPAQAATIVVTGKVTGLNAVPLEGVRIEAGYPNAGPAADDVYTAADGTYQLTLPSAGEYWIDIGCSGGACGETYAPDPTVKRAFSAATVLDATLERWGRITGTVKKNGVATAWPTGEIEAFNDVRAYWSSYPSVRVDANGAFTIEKVAPGTVTVRGHEAWGEENFLTTAPNQTFEVAPGQTAAISLAVEAWKGFYLRAVDPSGAPMDKVRWNVFSRTAGGAWDNGLQYGPLRTGADGRMSYQVTDGKQYTVCFYDDVYDDNFGAGSTRPNRYGTRCLGDTPDLTTATAWQPTAAQPKLKQDLALPLVGKSMRPGDPWTTGSGATKVGTPITVDPGVWAPLGVALSWQWKSWDGTQMVTIPGATSPTYTPTADMAGKTLIAFITGNAPGYAPATVTWGVNKVGGVAPTMAGSLSITGDLTVGSTVTAHAGTFTPSNTSTTWWWYLDGRPIADAQGDTITITEDMPGRRLEARVTAYAWDNGDNEYFNRVSVAVPGALKGTTPEITGTTTVGATLTAHAGTWTSGATLSYQWLRAGTPISGATSPTYPLVAADQGKAISVTVTGKLAGYTDVPKTSTATAPIAAATFTATPVPTISGTTTVGSTLTATVPAWTPAATTTTYQWLRDGAVVDGATSSTYVLAAADQGKKMSVRATGARAGYTSVTQTSALTAAVGAGTFAATPAPTISGTTKVGSTLTATMPAWTPAATTTTYQWLREGAPISGATGASYVLAADDAGKQISVEVTGSRDGYTEATEESAPIAAAAAAFSVVPTPTIAGTAVVGATLSADAGTWQPAAERLSYQWYRSGAPIHGATGSTYQLTPADGGTTLTVRVTGSRAGFADAEATSSATASVAQATFAQAPTPRIKGKARVGAKVKVVVGTWSPTPATTTYQWYRNGKPIKGATKAAYKVTKKDRRKRITVVVTQALPGHATVSATSAATKRIH